MKAGMYVFFSCGFDCMSEEFEDSRTFESDKMWQGIARSEMDKGLNPLWKDGSLSRDYPPASNRPYNHRLGLKVLQKDV